MPIQPFANLVELAHGNPEIGAQRSRRSREAERLLGLGIGHGGVLKGVG
jgi:hypothetical protein